MSSTRVITAPEDELDAWGSVIAHGFPEPVDYDTPQTVSELDAVLDDLAGLVERLAQWRPIVEAYEHGQVAAAPFAVEFARHVLEEWDRFAANGESGDENPDALRRLLDRIEGARLIVRA